MGAEIVDDAVGDVDNNSELGTSVIFVRTLLNCSPGFVGCTQWVNKDEMELAFREELHLAGSQCETRDWGLVESGKHE